MNQFLIFLYIILYHIMYSKIHKHLIFFKKKIIDIHDITYKMYVYYKFKIYSTNNQFNNHLCNNI